MKALILTCNTGQGHNAVSAAIQESILIGGGQCKIADALRFLSARVSKFVCSWHVRIYRHMPNAFRSGYRLAEKHPAAFEERSPIHRLIAAGVPRLYEYILHGGYDCLVCPHVISAMLATELLTQHPDLNIQSCFIATDYTCSPMTEESRLDWYFIPDPVLLPEFQSAGIPPERLVCTSGIPVRRAFYTKTAPDAAKQQCGIPPKSAHLLMMFGSMGCGPMEHLTRLLARQLPPETHMTVVCGTNTQLRRKLHLICAKRRNVHILGYVQNTPLLMDSADVFLTKPGGISTSEAAVKGLPMVLANTVAGCESYNEQFFLDRGGALAADTAESLAALCQQLLADAALREKMSHALYQKENAADEVCAKLSDFYRRKDTSEI